MKLLASILFLILVEVSVASTCSGINSQEIKELIAASRKMKRHVNDDVAFAKIRGKFSVSAQKELNGLGVEPIDFAEPKHHLDFQVLGDIEIDTIDKDRNPAKALGSAVKIGPSCIVTSAHVLYEQLHQKIADGNSGKFDKTIKFNRGHGNQKQSLEASVFFQMTKEGTDFIVKDGKRVFYGHNDLVVLKLNNHVDPYFRKVKVMSPSQVKNDSNPELGREMMCQGSPYYKTSKTYGSCKGSDFRWKQEKARVFEDDYSDEKGGMAANVASGPGMSGGPCYLNENPNEVFGLISNGFSGSAENPTLPNLEFGRNYAGGDAKYLSLFHVLDQRMKTELGYGLDQISEKCK